jgi:hypothetical protein
MDDVTPPDPRFVAAAPLASIDDVTPPDPRFVAAAPLASMDAVTPPVPRFVAAAPGASNEPGKGNGNITPPVCAAAEASAASHKATLNRAFIAPAPP